MTSKYYSFMHMKQDIILKTRSSIPICYFDIYSKFHIMKESNSMTDIIIKQLREKNEIRNF